MADDKKKRTWIAIAVAIVVILFILGVAIVGSAAFWIRRHIDTQFVSTDAAAGEFERERARFAGQDPLIDLSGDDRTRPTIHRRTAATRTELQTLRVLVFDPDASKLVRVSIPFWLLRLAPSKRFSMRGTDTGVDFDSERMNLTVDDLERAGPGLVLDTRSPRSGALVLVWAE